MANHTPGPWTVYQGRKPIDPYESEVITDEKGQAGSVVICRLAGANRQENAALIAAAPEMLAVLKYALFALENITSSDFACGGDKKVREVIASAIAKAEEEGQS